MPQGPAAPAERYIADLPLLARLPVEDMRALASRGRMRTFPAGTTIFSEGEKGDSLHVVVDGRVRISVTSGSGDEATVAMVGPGDCFGELSLLDGRPRSASAVASTITKTFVVTRDAFGEWVGERPAAALAILETLSLRLRRTDEALADLAFLDLAHRLAKQLIALASMHTAEGAPRLDPPVRINVTQGELASMLGVSRESVNKQLNAFAREGWLSLSRGAVILEKPGDLRTYA